MSLIKKFIPYRIAKTIFDIDYMELLKEKRKYIIFDLDNTIIPYHHSVPQEDATELVKKLKEMGFTVIIMSNNHSDRINKVATALDVYAISNAMKPLKHGYRKFIKDKGIQDKKEIIAIGDQLVTDVFGGARCKIDCIYVNAIDRKSEKWYTRLNRKTEKFIINCMKKKYRDSYDKIMEIRGETNA